MINGILFFYLIALCIILIFKSSASWRIWGNMFKKLRTVIYYVPDLQKAKAWYSNLAGVQPYFDEPFYVGFDFNGCELGLHPQDETVTKGNQTVSHWAVDEIENCVEKLLAAGATILYATSDVGGGIKVATVVDPWGNAVGLIEGA